MQLWCCSYSIGTYACMIAFWWNMLAGSPAPCKWTKPAKSDNPRSTRTAITAYWGRLSCWEKESTYHQSNGDEGSTRWRQFSSLHTTVSIVLKAENPPSRIQSIFDSTHVLETLAMHVMTDCALFGKVLVHMTIVLGILDLCLEHADRCKWAEQDSW